jgi:hypothetical protein
MAYDFRNICLSVSKLCFEKSVLLKKSGQSLGI